MLACAATAACHVGQNPRPDLVDPDSAARADIRATLDAYTTARLENDPDLLAPFFTSDARLSEPGLNDVDGAAAIRASMASLFERGVRVTGVGMNTEVVHLAGIDAFEFGAHVETVTDAAGVERTVRGRYVIHWRRGPEARWRIRRFLLNHLPEHAPQAAATPAAP
jgi:ketosteroid isomerase-like protein